MVGSHQTDDNACDSHEPERDELDDRGRRLELARELGRQGVHHERADEEDHHQHHAFGSDDAAALVRRYQQREVWPAGGDEDQRVAGSQPREYDRQGRIVDDAHEPADVVAVTGADRRFGVVDYAVDLLVLLRHQREGEYAEDHDEAADDPSQDAQRHVALGLLKYSLSLEEDSGPDNYADDHADRGKEPEFAFQFVCHMISSGERPPNIISVVNTTIP